MVRAPIFKKTYKDYLKQVARLDLNACRQTLGFDMEGDTALIPLFDRRYRVSRKEVSDSSGQRADLSVAVVLCKYLLLSPSAPLLSRDLRTFKDFKDAAPLISYFDSTVQGRIARNFSGRPNALEEACRTIGGKPYERELAYQLKYQFLALPKIPVYLLFNDAEEGFPAQCTLLFEQRVQNYLDMESLAILCGTLVHRLNQHK
ncbi:MAG: DUF3786 domain-containing protein [Desulfobacteraceae bacterium]|jgi:hypothetical protein